MGGGLGWWKINFPLLFMVCSGDLYVPRSRPSSHQVKLYSVIFMHKICSGSGSTPSDKGRGGGGGRVGVVWGRSQKNIFLALWASAWSKNKGGGRPPRTPPLYPPLICTRVVQREIKLLHCLSQTELKSCSTLYGYDHIMNQPTNNSQNYFSFCSRYRSYQVSHWSLDCEYTIFKNIYTVGTW